MCRGRRGSLLYLICTFWEYEDVRQLAMHRVHGATMTRVSAKRSTDFNLDRYIESAAFEYRVGEKVVFKAIFDRDAALHLDETPLSEDQTIQTVDEDYVLVTATVLDSAQLLWWLLGFGDLVEVLEPESLRVRTGTTLIDAAARYAVKVDWLTVDEEGK
jgi:predicted DNA-binding transcriptional regulator YafY